MLVSTHSCTHTRAWVLFSLFLLPFNMIAICVDRRPLRNWLWNCSLNKNNMRLRDLRVSYSSCILWLFPHQSCLFLARSEVFSSPSYPYTNVQNVSDAYRSQHTHAPVSILAHYSRLGCVMADAAAMNMQTHSNEHTVLFSYSSCLTHANALHCSLRLIRALRSRGNGQWCIIINVSKWDKYSAPLLLYWSAS